MFFKLNYGYYLCMFYKKNIDAYSKSKSANKLSIKLQKLITICYNNLYPIQKL